jgi:hypothetical protein
MAAAAADLEFLRSPQWKKFFGNPVYSGTHPEVLRRVGNHVLLHREDFGIRELSMAITGIQGQLWVAYYRRKLRPDKIHLLECKLEPFSEVQRAYYKEVFGEN